MNGYKFYYVPRNLENVEETVRKLMKYGDVKILGKIKVYTTSKNMKMLEEIANSSTLPITIKKTRKISVVKILRLIELAKKHGLGIDYSSDYTRFNILYKRGQEKYVRKLFESDVVKQLQSTVEISSYIVHGNSVNPNFYITINKEEYTHKVFRIKQHEPRIIFNKHYTTIDTGKNVINIDLGMEARNKKINSDFILLSHAHIDHSRLLIDKEFVERNNYRPYIHTNLPTIELLSAMRKDFPTIDIDELSKRVYLYNTVVFGDITSTSFYSAHAYGSNFFIQDTANGYTLLYFSDTNLYSKAFKVPDRHFIEKLNGDVDILAVEFPQHNFYTKVNIGANKNVIGTTLGEYEELLYYISDHGIMIDIDSSIYVYDGIRQKYKSYLKRELRDIKVDYGTFKDFMNSREHDVFITTKGKVVKLKGLSKKIKGMELYITNSSIEGIKTLKIKTHISIREIKKLVDIIEPKLLVIHHYNEKYERVQKELVEKTSVRTITIRDENKPLVVYPIKS